MLEFVTRNLFTFIIRSVPFKSLVYECAPIYARLPIKRNPMTAVTTNTRPQRFFSSGSNLRFGGSTNQPLPWVFTCWPRADSFPVSRALGRTSRFCNTLLQDLAPLHVKTTRSTNLLIVCRRKLKLSTYLQTVIYNNLSFLNARSQLVWILLALDSIQARSQVFFYGELRCKEETDQMRPGGASL